MTKTYMLAELQVRFGVSNLQKYQDTMVLIKRIFESEGIILKLGTITKVGKLYKMWNIWQIDDFEHVTRAMKNAINHPNLIAALVGLEGCVESETVHYLESMPFSPDFKICES